MSETKILGGLDASLAIAKVTLTRTLRGRALWVVLALSALPFFYASAIRVDDVHDIGRVLPIWALLLVILPPVLLASAIAEEIEERTMSYLWSRPIPRWSIVIGKMIALVPILWIALGASILAAYFGHVPGAAENTELVTRLIAMVLLSTLGASAVTVGITTLVPRFGTIIAIAYLLFVDAPLGGIDASIRRVSVLGNAIDLAGVGDHTTTALTASLWLVGWIAFWIGLAAARIRRLE